MPSILITGSNRGIGLELAWQYARAQWRVFATCHHPAEADALHNLAASHRQVPIHRLDVTIAEDIRAITWELENAPVGILFNSAGVYLENDYLSRAGRNSLRPLAAQFRGQHHGSGPHD